VTSQESHGQNAPTPSSREHPSSKKKRPSDQDDDPGHTSAPNRLIKGSPQVTTPKAMCATALLHLHHPSTSSHPAAGLLQSLITVTAAMMTSCSTGQNVSMSTVWKPCDSRDSGARPGQLMLVEQESLNQHHSNPTQSAAVAAAAAVKKLAKQQHAYAGPDGACCRLCRKQRAAFSQHRQGDVPSASHSACSR